MKQAIFIFVAIFFVLFLTNSPLRSAFSDINSYDSENLEYSLSSPYHTILTHLFYLQKQTYKPYISAKALDPGTKISDDEKQLTLRLKAIFDGRGLNVDFNIIPRNEDYIDTTTNLPIYYPFPKFKDIYLEKDGNKWFYSKKTVSRINAIYDGMFILGTAELASKLPFQLWQILSTLVLLVFSVFLFILINFLSKKIIHFVVRKYWSKEINIKKCDAVSRPITIFIVLIAFEQLLPITQLGIKIMQFSLTGISVSMSIVFTLLVYNISNLILTIVHLKDDKYLSKSSNVQLVSFLVITFKVITVITGIVLVLNSFTINITGVLAGLSIGGLALALAAQDTVKNLFGSVMLFIDKPFKVGDYIKGELIDGEVEDIGFRSTRIRTFEDSLIYIPNGRLADMTIDNFGLRKFRRIKAVIQIDYNSYPPAIIAFTEAIRKIITDHPLSRKDFLEVNLNSFGDSSMNILMLVYFNIPTWQEELRLRQEVFLQVLELAKKLGIRLAFPTQIIFMENEEILTKRTQLQTEKDHRNIVAEYFENKNKEKPTEN